MGEGEKGGSGTEGGAVGEAPTAAVRPLRYDPATTSARNRDRGAARTTAMGPRPKRRTARDELGRGGDLPLRAGDQPGERLRGDLPPPLPRGGGSGDLTRGAKDPEEEVGGERPGPLRDVGSRRGDHAVPGGGVVGPLLPRTAVSGARPYLTPARARPGSRGRVVRCVPHPPGDRPSPPVKGDERAPQPGCAGGRGGRCGGGRRPGAPAYVVTWRRRRVEGAWGAGCGSADAQPPADAPRGCRLFEPLAGPGRCEGPDGSLCLRMHSSSAAIAAARFVPKPPRAMACSRSPSGISTVILMLTSVRKLEERRQHMRA